ncbi:winged helix-turn-helix domain-containing protein [Shewanella sp. GXUN23E]|uniref:winged helix-turn-helix domain-containing protein n=1 Tax=Shewanella sp. GXUN23E TaxID=3422498 RepID=UPI003D7CBE8B
MRIGGCQFHEKQGKLVNPEGQEWQLPRAELQVLRLLTQHRGQLVCKQQLREGQGEGAMLSESSVARAVFMLRSFLGPSHEYLIETVKGQGYLLLPEPHSDEPFPEVLRRSGIKTPALLLLGAAVLLSALWGLHRFLFAPAPVVTPPVSLLQTDSVRLASGQTIALSLYAKSKTNSGLLKQQAGILAQTLSLCRQSHWQHVYLSLSHDNQVLNLTMRGMKRGQSEVRNLKISDSRNPKEFVSQRWLQQVGICD